MGGEGLRSWTWYKTSHTGREPGYGRYISLSMVGIGREDVTWLPTKLCLLTSSASHQSQID
eukprot:4977118-Prymnesium_polylepis.1